MLIVLFIASEQVGPDVLLTCPTEQWVHMTTYGACYRPTYSKPELLFYDAQIVTSSCVQHYLE